MRLPYLRMTEVRGGGGICKLELLTKQVKFSPKFVGSQFKRLLDGNRDGFHNKILFPRSLPLRQLVQMCSGTSLGLSQTDPLSA